VTPYYEDAGITLYLGDAQLIVSDLPADSFDMVLTDPPYGMNYKSGWSGAKVSMDGTRAALRMYRQLIPELVRVMRDGSHMYWFTRWDVFADAVDSLTPFLPVANMLVWDKGHPGMGDLTLYGYSHELVLFAVKGKRPLVGGRPGNIFRHNPVPPVHRTHVTEKPVGLLRPWIEASAPDCLLDPFAGSGSALLAAQQLGRRAVGVEIEERYCEAAATRLSAARDDLFGGAA
jgi:site-specific DNA-methyltransferase (adenine-specific)